jgi:hypothetical protein
LLAETDEMAVRDEPRLLAANRRVARRPITVTEYHRMDEVGILGDRDRVELIEGELVAMSPIGSNHHGTANQLTHALVHAVGERAIVSVPGPVRLGWRPCVDVMDGVTSRLSEPEMREDQCSTVRQ